MRKLLIRSFGIKRRNPEQFGPVIDCRILQNPHELPKLRHLDGRDMQVKEFVMMSSHASHLMHQAMTAVQNGAMEISFMCYGGRHRSVAMAEALKDRLEDVGMEVDVDHMEL